MIAVVAVAVLALIAGRWALAGALTATVAQMAAVLPVTVAFGALAGDDPLRWLTALSGVALGAAVAGVRWRVPIAAALAVLTALTLFIAYDATTEDPEKLVAQHVAIPAVLILILCAAVAGAVTGATAPALAAQGALPVVLGPLVGVLAVGGLQAIQVTESLGAVSQYDVIPAAILFLVAGLAVSGLGLARLLTARSAERKHAEQIRRESAAAERDRLGRSIHDGVLQVLALVQREGQDLGGHAGELAALAGQQEVALRSLLAREADEAGNASKAADLRVPLQALTGPAVEVATPAQPVELPSAIAVEVVAAVRAALDNVRRHAGPDARAWILLEEERDGVRVTVRDDGTGFPPARAAAAAAPGRLAIAPSRRGRIADCGGTTTIDEAVAGTRHRCGILDTPDASGPPVNDSGRGIGPVNPVRVMVVDDHPIFRDAVARDLVEAGYDVTAVIGEGAQAVRVAPASPATTSSFSISNCQIPAGGGSGSPIDRHRPGDPRPDAVSQRRPARRTRRAGRPAYPRSTLVKSTKPADLIRAVARTAAGEPVFTVGTAGLVLGEYRRLAAVPAKPADTPSLTARETEVLRLVAKGHSYKQIAERLVVSHRTVQNHVQNSLGKLHLHNRVELTRYAIEQGFDQDI